MQRLGLTYSSVADADAVVRLVIERQAQPATRFLAPFVAAEVRRVGLAGVRGDLGSRERAEDAERVVGSDRVHPDPRTIGDRGVDGDVEQRALAGGVRSPAVRFAAYEARAQHSIVAHPQPGACRIAPQAE